MCRDPIASDTLIPETIYQNRYRPHGFVLDYADYSIGQGKDDE